MAQFIEEAWKAASESIGLSHIANSVPVLAWLDTLEQSLLKAFNVKHFDELGCGTFVQNVNKVISGIRPSSDVQPSASASGALSSDVNALKCQTEDAWCRALDSAMAEASEIGSPLEGLQQLESLVHRQLAISSDVCTSLLSQSSKHSKVRHLTL
jgi:hypothetical protein